MRTCLPSCVDAACNRRDSVRTSAGSSLKSAMGEALFLTLMNCRAPYSSRRRMRRGACAGNERARCGEVRVGTLSYSSRPSDPLPLPVPAKSPLSRKTSEATSTFRLLHHFGPCEASAALPADTTAPIVSVESVGTAAMLKGCPTAISGAEIIPCCAINSAVW